MTARPKTGAARPDAPAWAERLSGAERPHAILLCGLPGAGKTVLAARLAVALGAVRFGADAWMLALFGERLPRDVFDRHRTTLQELLWRTATQVLALGHHVVFDDGFWTRADRATAARRALEAGATPLIAFLDVPRDELERRLARRTEAGATDAYAITPAMLDLFAARFEPPEAGEEIAVVRVGTDGEEVESTRRSLCMP